MTDPSGYRDSGVGRDSEPREGTRRWIKVAAIVVAVVILLIVVVRLIGGGDGGGHGPGRHGMSDPAVGEMTLTRS